MKDKVLLITGSTGIAEATATLAAQDGARVFVVSRTAENARALYLDDRIGSIGTGLEADLIVLDLQSTPLIEARLAGCESLDEALFVQMTLGDDRAVAARYVAGKAC
jgi:cytosine/adenosine deaminase-related metal-dependent hydrolase